MTRRNSFSPFFATPLPSFPIPTGPKSVLLFALQVSEEGQAVFDRLLKACNEVEWKGEKIIVLNQIQVDPPYTPESCLVISHGNAKPGVRENSSLERVKKIVAASKH